MPSNTASSPFLILKLLPQRIYSIPYEMYPYVIVCVCVTLPTPPQGTAASPVLCADLPATPAGHELGAPGPAPLPGHQAARPAPQHVPGEHQRP